MKRVGDGLVAETCAEWSEAHSHDSGVVAANRQRIAGSHAGMAYRADIDGLRAIAVLSVVLYHARLPGFSGGFAGVDIFFVISGYLITGIIVAGKERSDFSLLSFYERRARRILPALYLVVAACIPAAWLWMMPFQLKDFAASVISVATFTSNILFWQNTGYFAHDAASMPLLHTWSLAIEEQFYIFFPLMIIALWRFGKGPLIYVFAVMFCLSLLLSQWGARHAFNANFFLLPTRAWELLLGGIATCCPRETLTGEPRVNNALSATGILLIVSAVFFYGDTTPFPSVYSLVPTVGALLVILFVTPATVAGKLLSLRPVVGLGLISYSVYLWHYPLFAFARIQMMEPPNAYLASALICAIFVAAYLSWRFVEQPFRNKRIVPRPAVISLAAGGMALFLIIGSVEYLSNGLQRQFASRFGHAVAAIDRAIATRGYEGMFTDDACRFWSTSLDAAFVERFNRCAATGKAAYLIIGDSHAMDLYNALFQNSSYPFLVLLAKGGCRPYDSEADCPYEPALDFVKNRRANIRQVFFTQSGSYFLEGESDRVIEKDISRVDRYLDRLAISVPVVWFGPQMETGVDLQKLHPARTALPPQDRDLQRGLMKVDQAIEDFARKDGRVRYVSKIKAIHYRHSADFLIDGEYTYSDVDHWSTYGERIFGERLVNYLNKSGFGDL